MPIERINPEGLRKYSTYSQVVKAGNTIHIAGQAAEDEHGTIVGLGDIEAQATQVLNNIKIALEAAGATFDHVVRLVVYVTDPRYRDTVREVRTRYFTGALPASTFLVVSQLADPGHLLEIDVTAVVE